MRYSINTADAFYLAEKEYYDEVGPQAQNYLLEYTRPCWRRRSDRSWRRVDRIIPPWCSASFEVELKAMSPEIVQDMIEENRLVSQYS